MECILHPITTPFEESKTRTTFIMLLCVCVFLLLWFPRLLHRNVEGMICLCIWWMIIILHPSATFCHERNYIENIIDGRPVIDVMKNGSQVGLIWSLFVVCNLIPLGICEVAVCVQLWIHFKKPRATPTKSTSKLMDNKRLITRIISFLHIPIMLNSTTSPFMEFGVIYYLECTDCYHFFI